MRFLYFWNSEVNYFLLAELPICREYSKLIFQPADITGDLSFLHKISPTFPLSVNAAGCSWCSRHSCLY